VSLNKTNTNKALTIIGGGLAGCEAAWRAATLGLKVKLWEMKPQKYSPAHSNPDLAELVCSNSLRAEDSSNAVGLLKEELTLLGSIVMEAALAHRVSAGRALAVDRVAFSRYITEKVESHPNIEVIRQEFRPPLIDQGPLIVACGPLATDEVTSDLAQITGSDHLNFYDALAPIVEDDSLDKSKLFLADRYGPPEEGDYLNAPFTQNELNLFIAALLEADRARARPFEEEKYFEGCLPIEVMAQRGVKTLCFGPMKPVGLIDPKSGRRPAAIVQLRRENAHGSHWNIVGFQTRLTIPAQEKVFRLIPGLEKVKFARYGAIHRNTYLVAPKVLDDFQCLVKAPDIFIAGQLSGVEGYVESAAQGLWAGENAARRLLGLAMVQAPPETALGSLVGRLTKKVKEVTFCPSNVNFGLFPPVDPQVPKKDQAAFRLERARKAWPSFLKDINYAR
jgi:methylenetetrahydrofolate--tRNA-(uracil-5-)-methyltransferase